LRSFTWFCCENLLDRITVAKDPFQTGTDCAVAYEAEKAIHRELFAQIWRRTWLEYVWNARPVSRPCLTSLLGIFASARYFPPSFRGGGIAFEGGAGPAGGPIDC
jgi:hypothetical protein